MIVYDKEQKQIVIPNGLGNVNIIINQGCDDDKPTPPQDGWGMTGIFNNWGDSPDIPFKENGEWGGRPYKVIRNFGATGGEFKIRRNNAWDDSYTASFHNEPQFAQLLKNDFSMSIDDGIWDIYLFFGNDGEPNEMLILHPGTDLSTIQYEYTLTISTDKENAIIEIADSYRGMTDRYCGDVTVTMKYGCIYYINIYMEGYEDISDEITCYNDEGRNYTLTKIKYNTIADIYGLPSDSTVTFKGLVALSFVYGNRGDYILFTDHTGSIILKNCQVPLNVGDECLVTATLKRFDGVYISALFNPSIEVLSNNNYVVMPTNAIELTNLNDLYIPNKDGYAEMKYLYADGTVVRAPSLNFMRIQTDATKPDSIALRGDFSNWEGKLAEGDNIRVYMFPENSTNAFWVTDIIKLEGDSCNLGVLDLTLTSPYTEIKNAISDGYVGYSQVTIRPENIIAQEKESAINHFKNEMKEITITENGTYSIDSQEKRQYIEFDGNSYFDTNIPFGENTKIEVAVTKANYYAIEQIIGTANYDLVADDYCGFGIVLDNRFAYGVYGKAKTNNIPFYLEKEQILTLDRNGIHSSYDNMTGGWINDSGLGDSSVYGTTIGIGKIHSVANGWTHRGLDGRIRYVKIWTNKNDDSTMTLFRPKNMTQGAFGVVNSEGVETGHIENLGEGTTTFVEENVNIYPNGFKRVEVNVPDLNGSYNEGYAQGKTDGVNEQKSKLESISITQNGVYSKEDGYNHIEVNVPDLNGSYNEGYAQGKTDGVNEQKSKLEPINITENGTYRKENGYSEVVVNVPDLNGSYDQGKADVVANARVLNVTENGTYLSKYSEPVAPTLVTGIYADGTEFHNYAELNGKVFNTKIAGSVDSRLEFWYKGDNTVASDGWNAIIGAGNNDNRDCFQVRYWDHNNNRLLIEIGNSGVNYYDWDDTVWHHLIISKVEGLWIDGEKKWDFSSTNTVNGEFFINGVGYNTDGTRNANGCFGMIKIDDTIIIPTANGFQNVNTGELLEVVKDGTYTFTENLPIYGEGELYKTINVNVAPKINVQEAGISFSRSTFTEVPEWADFKGITNMSNMFSYCYILQTIPLLDTSNVTDMSLMFGYCDNLQTIPSLDTSKVTDMFDMFIDCSSLVSLPALNAQSLDMPSYDCIFDYNELPELTDFGGFLNLKCSLTNDGNLKRLPNLTYESCINVLNGLYDFVGNGETPNSNQGQLKVHQNFLDKVGNEISIGTNKGWTITA